MDEKIYFKELDQMIEHLKECKQLPENQQEKRKDFFGKRPRLAIFKFGGSIS